MFEDQHRRLLQFLTTLTDSVNVGISRETQSHVLLQFIDYAVYHFKEEAELIEEYGYPEYLLQYESEHARLTRELEDLRWSVREPDFVLDTQSLLLLKNVLQSHIFSDEKYLVRRTEKAESGSH